MGRPIIGFGRRRWPELGGSGTGCRKGARENPVGELSVQCSSAKGCSHTLVSAGLWIDFVLEACGGG